MCGCKHSVTHSVQDCCSEKRKMRNQKGMIMNQIEEIHLKTIKQHGRV